MTDVFISYKKEDVARVKPIAEALAGAGYDVWWDHRIPPGRTYREVIGTALETAKCVIVVWSEASTQSQWVLDEADAGQKRRVLLPILIDNVMPPYGFGQIEAARLIDWQGNTDMIEWKHTVEAVAGLVGRAPGEAPPVSITMPSGGGSVGESPAMTRATPGAALDVHAAAEQKAKGGGGAGMAIAAVLALAVVGGGGYYAWSSGLLDGGGGETVTNAGSDTDDAAGEAVTTARVFIHISDESQRREADQVANALRMAGHTVQGVKNVGEYAPREGEIRYFNAASAQAAEAASQALQGGYLPSFTPVLNPDFPNTTVGDVELYFSYIEPTDETGDTGVAPPADPDPDPPTPAQRFPGVTSASVRSVTVPDGSSFGILPDGRWAQKHRGGELMGTYRETQRTETSVFMRQSDTNAPLEIDLLTGTIFRDPYTNKQVFYTISGASNSGITMPQGRGFPGINGENVMSVTHQEGGTLSVLADGLWAALDESGLPETMLRETGRDEWSVYLTGEDGEAFTLDLYMKEINYQEDGNWQKMGDLLNASVNRAPAPQITNARGFMFGSDLRFERISGGAQPQWQEIQTTTGQRTYVWTQVSSNGPVMELTDDGRGARMRVNLLEGMVYLYFPDWGEFKPQWEITEVS